MQGQDLTLKSIREALERGVQRPKITFKKDILYREVGKGGEKKIAAPSVLIPAVFSITMCRL
jgi:hypothetical protein